MERKLNWRVIGVVVLAIVSALIIRAGLQPCAWLDLALKRCGCLCTLEELRTKWTVSPSRRMAHLWQVTNGAPLQTMEGHTDGVVSVAFSPDGTTLASGSLDCTAKLWRVSDGALLHEWQPSSVVASVAFSPDGSALAINRQLWRVDDWTFLREMKSQRGGMGNVVFSPDGKMLAAGNASHEVRWWRVADGTLLRAVKGHVDSVNSVAFSPDGEILASGSLDGTVRLWRVPTEVESLSLH